MWESLSYHGTTVGSPNSKHESDHEFSKAGVWGEKVEGRK